MNRRVMVSLIAGAVALVLVGAGAYRLGKQAAPHAATAADGKAGKGRTALYWHDPMVPGQKFDKPGKSPFMDMELVPVYADAPEAAGTVAVSPAVQQNLGIRIVEVRKGNLASALDAVGNVAFNERDLVLSQARASGYVEQLFVRTPLERVRKGQALLQLYVPEWVAAQEEYLAVKRMPAGSATAGLLEAARQRMRLAGMTDEQVGQVVTRSQRIPGTIVTAPVDGVVTELAAREGMAVTLGTPLFRINGLRTVWVNAEVPERAAAQVKPGMAVQASSPAFPGETFSGKVEALLPEVNAATRTLKARIELANPGAKLVPGMFATVRMTLAQSREALLIPAEAVIQTGLRNVVITLLADGRFAPAEIATGAEANGEVEVIKGLSPGQKVVASGQFLIDSEASLRGTLERLGGEVATYRATGKVERIAGDKVTISHEPIPSLKWGPMTMGFAAPPGGLPTDIKAGDQVQFEIRKSDGGGYQIVSMSHIADASVPAGAGK